MGRNRAARARGRSHPRRGEDIAVANSFVAAATARSFREAAGVDRAIEEILAEVGTAFDRRVVSALTHFIDNRGGRALFKRPHRRDNSSNDPA